MVGQSVDATVDWKADPWVAHSADQMADPRRKRTRLISGLC